MTFNFIQRITFRHVLCQLVVAASYCLLGIIFQLTFSSNGIVSVIWPSSGLALATLLIGGESYIWGIFLGALTLNFLLDSSIVAATGITLANIAEPLLGYRLLTRHQKSHHYLESLPSYMKLIILGGGVVSLVGGILGPFSLLLAGFISASDYLKNALHWWMGDTLGVVIITTLMLAWCHISSLPSNFRAKISGGHAFISKRQLEGLLLIAVTVILGQIVFLDWFSLYLSDTPKGYLMFFFVAWIAIRQNARWVTLVVLLIAVQGLFGAYHQLGYFAHDLARADLFNYWTYMLIISIIGMALTSYVAEVKHKELKLQKSETQLSTLVDAIPDLIWLKSPDGVYLSCNQMFERFFGAKEADIIGKTDYDFIEAALADDFVENDRVAMITNKPHYSEKWLTFAEGYYHGLFETTKMALRDKEGQLIGVMGIAHDITERKRTADEIEQLAFYDALTHLPNRRMLLDKLNHAYNASDRNGLDGALLFLDLDHFKMLNDSLGHAIGDLLLQQVATRLSDCLREGDTIARVVRLGGDEFVVMLENLSNNAIEAASQAAVVGNKILASLSQPFQLATHEYLSSVSVGVALFSDHKFSQEDLLKHADIAMYQAKKAGRNTMRFFDPDMQDAINHRANMERELRKAIEQKQFELYYQVQVNHLEQPIGAEALIRWNHPQRGVVDPIHFISLAEETGIILIMGQWALDTACAQLKSWQNHPLTRQLTISINVSAKEFNQAHFVIQVQDALQRYGVAPNLLKLELTESLLLDNVGGVIVSMAALEAIGVQFSLDDFGTGYSSLQYLKMLPINQLKIDRSFIRDLATDGNDRSIVRTIIAMAKSLGIEVIAEGVETEVQRNLLANKGCQCFQGYYFGDAQPIAAFNATLKQLHSNLLNKKANPKDSLFY